MFSNKLKSIKIKISTPISYHLKGFQSKTNSIYKKFLTLCSFKKATRNLKLKFNLKSFHQSPIKLKSHIITHVNKLNGVLSEGQIKIYKLKEKYKAVQNQPKQLKICLINLFLEIHSKQPILMIDKSNIRNLTF